MGDWQFLGARLESASRQEDGQEGEGEGEDEDEMLDEGLEEDGAVYWCWHCH